MIRRLLLVTSLFWAAPVAATQATVTVPLWTGAALQNSQITVSKPVRSWKDLKFTGLIRQQTDFSCGAAVLATIFHYAYGRRTSEKQVLVNMMKVADPVTVKEKGFSLLDMKNYVSAIGMTGAGFSVTYDALLQLKVPAIALLNIKGYKHFVVIRKATKDYIQLGDPALGNRVMSRREFERGWNGVVFVVLADGYDPDNSLANPPLPMIARRFFDLRPRIENANPEDFGIKSAVFSF
jgi:predicted double-glycine peptidase